MASARVKAGGWKVRACVRNSYFSMVHTALRPLHRKIRPKTTKRMGQVPPSRTGQPMESSTNLPRVSGCSATKATPPLPIFMVWPEPAATGTPWSAVLYRRSRSMAKRRLPRLSCSLVLGFMDRFLRRFSPPKVHFRVRRGASKNQRLTSVFDRDCTATGRRPVHAAYSLHTIARPGGAWNRVIP